jgi:hypothetical protein
MDDTLHCHCSGVVVGAGAGFGAAKATGTMLITRLNVARHKTNTSPALESFIDSSPGVGASCGGVRAASQAAVRP